jgi:hypothetical protein
MQTQQQPLFQFPTTQASPAQVAATPKPLQPVVNSPPIIATPKPLSTNQPTVSATITPPSTRLDTVTQQQPVQPQTIKQSTVLRPPTGTSVRTGTAFNTGTNTGVVPPSVTLPVLNDFQRARAGLVSWLNDAGILATMAPEAKLAGKDQILSNPDSSATAKALAALVTRATPQLATDNGVKVIIIPDDVFASYLGAFNLTKRLLNLPESVNTPSAKTIANAIPAIQALINLLDLAMAGQALPTEIPAVLKDSSSSLWWLWTLLGVGAVGTAAYILFKRKRAG